MIGYLRPGILSPAHRELYRSYLCGLCHCVGERYGLRYRALVNADLVFYGLLLDLLHGDLSPSSRRRCVLLPVGKGRPTRVASERLQLAAAMGVTLVGEKLVDDVQDEGGVRHHLAAWLTQRGRTAAADDLAQAGFPVHELRAWMDVQRQLESRDALDLAQAEAPTRAIAALVLGFAGRHRDDAPRWRAVGAEVGSFLFHMDNLLDFHRDVSAGGYNALARARSHCGSTTLSAELRQRGLAGAEAAVARLRCLLAGTRLPHGGYLAQTLLVGFDDKIARYRALSPQAEPDATLRSILPRARRPDRGERVTRALRRSLDRFWVKAWVSAASFAMLLLPRRLWAETWWPADQATLPPGLDTGLGPQDLIPLEDAGLAMSSLNPATNTPVDDALCSSVGYCDPGNECGLICDALCCDPLCGDCEDCGDCPDCDCDSGGEGVLDTGWDSG